MADACVDSDVVTCADFDAELVHAASATVARHREIAIATDLTPLPARGPPALSPASVHAAFVVALTGFLPVPPALLFPDGLAAAVRGPAAVSVSSVVVGGLTSDYAARDSWATAATR